MNRIAILLLMMCMAQPVVAQKRVDILRAGRGTGAQTDKGFVRTLTGNVLLRSEKITVACDSAVHYVDLDELYAYGNITITTESETIRTQKLFYNTRTEWSRLENGVTITRDSTVLTSRTTEYSFETEIAVFKQPLQIQDPQGLMLAQRGTYFAKFDSAMVFGNVQVSDSTYYLEADSVYTNRKTESHRLFGRVYLFDKEENTRLIGAYVEADSTGRRLIRGDAFIEQIDSTEADTTYMRAAEILVQRDAAKQRTILATGGVMSWSADYATLSDTTHVFEADSLTLLRGSPRAWHKEMQLSGEALDIRFRNEKIHQIVAYGAPSAAQLDSVTQRVHQMKGDTLLLSFSDGEISLFRIYPKATVLYHNHKDDNSPDGAIELNALSIEVIFEDGDVVDVRAWKSIDGSFLEESVELNTRRMPGVLWQPEEKPVRPSERPTPRLSLPVPS
jgi:lipopolysaccharide export system protein LptA